VKVHAAAANAGDWHLLRGTPFPFRLVTRTDMREGSSSSRFDRADTRSAT